jgi:hypothetical protein
VILSPELQIQIYLGNSRKQMETKRKSQIFKNFSDGVRGRIKFTRKIDYFGHFSNLEKFFLVRSKIIFKISHFVFSTKWSL